MPHFAWDTASSIILQHGLDELCSCVLDAPKFSLTVADPEKEDCPIVACGDGFAELTGYSVHEIVGRNCRFLMDNVPWHLIDTSVHMKCREFIERSSARGRTALQQPEAIGELCVQVNAKKSGQLFQNAFILGDLDVARHRLIFALHCALPEDCLCNNRQISCLQQAFETIREHCSTLEDMLVAPLRPWADHRGLEQSVKHARGLGLWPCAQIMEDRSEVSKHFVMRSGWNKQSSSFSEASTTSCFEGVEVDID